MADGTEPTLPGLTVYILPDNDDAGRSHADKVAASLHEIAAGVRIVTLPGLAKGGDVSDWLDGGGNADQLVALCQAAPLWAPVAADRGSAHPPESAFLIPYCDESLTLAFSAAPCRRPSLLRDLRRLVRMGRRPLAPGHHARRVLAGPAAVPEQVGRGARHHRERENRREDRRAWSPVPRRWPPSSIWRAPMPATPPRPTTGTPIRGR